MMLRGSAFVLIVTLFVRDVTSQSGPPGCTYSDGVYTCDYTTMSSGNRPIDFTQFTETPQQLVVESSGFFPAYGDSRAFSAEFSTSSGINLANLNENSPASLTMDCGWGGSIYIAAGSFYDMEYIEHLKFKNCGILYIGTDTFDAFVELDYFGLEGGSFDQLEVLAFSGLSVEKRSSAVRNSTRAHGMIDVRNTEFVNGVVDSAFLSYFEKIAIVSIRNAGLLALSRSMFSLNTLVKIIDLSDNSFTEIPEDFLNSLNGLSEMVFYNIPWQCSCSDLWWVGTSISEHIHVEFDGMCNNINGMSVFKYYHENCMTPAVCEGTTGIAMGDKCATVLSILVMCFSVLACPATIVALVLAIMNFKAIPESDEDGVAEIDENTASTSNTAQNNNQKPGAGRPVQQRVQPAKSKFVNQKKY